ERQYLFLAQQVFDLDGKYYLVELAQEGLVQGEEEVARYLHGDGRAAGTDFLVTQQIEDGACQPLGIDSAVFEEAFIFGGEGGVDEVRRELVISQRNAAFAAEFRNQVAIGGVDA